MIDDDLPVAVLLIHGIGEQMPMDTVRSMVSTVFGPGVGDGAQRIHNKVDRHSSFLDLRRLVLAAKHGHNRVDFYELYWAPTFAKGTVVGVLSWAARQLFRSNTGKQMRHIVFVARALLGLFVGVYVVAILAGLRAGWGLWAILVPTLAGISIALFGPWFALRRAFTEVLADASRWFAPRPRDLAQRDEVRRIGLRLLEALHAQDDRGGQRYGRIIVIGHSLGSVIAYDVLRLAFDRLREPTLRPASPEITLMDRQPAAWHFSLDCHRLRLIPEVDRQGDPGVARSRQVSAFQHVQRQVHSEQRAAGAPWLVTDLITLGSPLTHADDLWRSEVLDFRDRLTEGEFPSCPPVGEVQHREAQWERVGVAVPIDAGKGPVAFYRREKEGPLIAHEASVFALTNWTNIYIPMRWWLGGDPVGGPLSHIFGPGIQDVPVRVSSRSKTRWRVMAIPVKAHTWYWRRAPGTSQEDVRNAEGNPDAVRRLAQAMDLGRKAPKPYRVRPLA